jgi:hypothetical protein
MDVMSILDICQCIHHGIGARYTIQRYNCYFFAWTIVLVLLRRLSANWSYSNVIDAAQPWAKTNRSKNFLRVLPQAFVEIMEQYHQSYLTGTVLRPTDPIWDLVSGLAHKSTVPSMMMDEVRKELELNIECKAGEQHHLHHLPLWVPNHITYTSPWRGRRYGAQFANVIGETLSGLADVMPRREDQGDPIQLREVILPQSLERCLEQLFVLLRLNVLQTVYELPPNVTISIQTVRRIFSHPLEKSVSLTSTGMSSQTNTRQRLSTYDKLQLFAKDVIKIHTDKVDRYQLGSSKILQNDIMEAMESAWKSLAEISDSIDSSQDLLCDAM